MLECDTCSIFHSYDEIFLATVPTVHICYRIHDPNGSSTYVGQVYYLVTCLYSPAERQPMAFDQFQVVVSETTSMDDSHTHEEFLDL